MKDVIEQRLNDLKTEHANGQRLIADLDTRRDSLRSTLLRIAGAIQVLEELLAADASADAAAPAVSVASLGPGR